MDWPNFAALTNTAAAVDCQTPSVQIPGDQAEHEERRVLDDNGKRHKKINVNKRSRITA